MKGTNLNWVKTSQVGFFKLWVYMPNIRGSKCPMISEKNAPLEASSRCPRPKPQPRLQADEHAPAAAAAANPFQTHPKFGKGDSHCRKSELLKFHFGVPSAISYFWWFLETCSQLNCSSLFFIVKVYAPVAKVNRSVKYQGRHVAVLK